MDRGAWDRTAALMWASIAAMSADAAKKLKPDAFNPYRARLSKPTMADLFAGLRQMKAEKDRLLQNGKP